MEKDSFFYVNGRFLEHSMNGISRFATELCKQLLSNKVSFWLIIPEWLKYNNEHDFNIITYGKRKSHLWEQIDLLNFLNENGRPRLLNLSGIGPIFYKNQIITIHDLSFFVNPRWFSRTYSFFYKVCTPIVAKNALHIITVSNFSKGEILKYLNIDENKITVVNNAVSTVLVNLDEKVMRYSKKPFVLAVSSIDPRKNQQRLLNVFSQPELKNFNLVLVGKKNDHFNIELNHTSSNIVFTGFLSDKELRSLYQTCALFVYPSLYEGFGIPPLEAMKNNCIAVVSEIPSLREVCGDGAFYVNPYDEESIKNGILYCLNDESLRDELRANGRLIVDKFSWVKSAEKLTELLRQKKFLS